MKNNSVYTARVIWNISLEKAAGLKETEHTKKCQSKRPKIQSWYATKAEMVRKRIFLMKVLPILET